MQIGDVYRLGDDLIVLTAVMGPYGDEMAVIVSVPYAVTVGLTSRKTLRRERAVLVGKNFRWGLRGKR